MSVLVHARAPLHRRAAALLLGRVGRASAWLSLGAAAGGVLGYAFQVLMGRLLSTQEYGLFGAAMALFAVLSAPLATLQMVLARAVSALRAAGDEPAVGRLYRTVVAVAAVAGALFLAAFALAAPQVQAYLRSPAIAPVYVLGALVVASVLPIVNNGFLQGLQRFAWLSASGALAPAVKIGLSAALIAAGLGLAGAIGGVALTALATWAFTYAALRRPLAAARGYGRAPLAFPLRRVLPVLVANAAFAAMTQLDMVVVNYLFGPEEASLYAAASVLGKAVLYLPGGIAMALFPMVAENDARDEASAHLLLQAVGLTLVLCTAGAVAYLVLGEWLVVLLYGEGYRGAGAILRYFGFAMLPLALVLVAEHFLIAKGRVLFAYLFMVFAPLQLGAIYLWHPSPLAVLAVVGASGITLAGVGYGLLWREYAAAPSPAATPQSN